jgi:hypothetical protein
MHHQRGQIQLNRDLNERSGDSTSSPNAPTVATQTQTPSSICDENNVIKNHQVA